jgi:UTP:GlnB (protein PII) uridylyltransferase
MSALEQLAERTRSGFPNLFAARARTERELRDKRESVREVGVDDDAAVVLFGSWGRHELTPHSDDDWVILVNGGERDGVRPSTDEMERRIGVAERKPGAQGVFGDIVFAPTWWGESDWTRMTTAT